MLKYILITASLIAFFTARVHAQTRSRDSEIKIAKADAQNFRLDTAVTN